ncbi:hypothetical protein F5887DRAFT_1069172 [Amanita rubescens]|nr:hypothetical protein F5887DRAFT_1069172 [Amanita rubescens]
MVNSASSITLPPFRTLSRIAARGRDDPNGELWRRSLGTELSPPPLGVPHADFWRSIVPPSLNLPVPQQIRRRAISEGHSPQGISVDGRSGHLGRSRASAARLLTMTRTVIHMQVGSETSSSNGSDDTSLSADSPSAELGWESLVAKGRDEGNYVVYECRWTGDDNQFCGYTAKRQLVKRHVEDKHLRIKRYECTFCGRRFAQVRQIGRKTKIVN